MILELTNLRSGAVLDYTFGHETDEALEIPIQGLADPRAFVTIDGVPAKRMDRQFTGTTRLTKRINEVTVCASSQYGELSQTLTLVWDKKAFKRYNFALDDNSFFLTEIACERPKSLFDHFYLKALRDINRKYGTCFTLNCFYRDDHHGFEMKDFPDCYKSEFEDNSAWMRLAFHSYSEFPGRPYQNASSQKLAADYDLIASEIIRFAGEKTLIAPTNIHWAMQPPNTLHVLRERGMRVNTASFIMEGERDASGRQTRYCDVNLFYEKDVSEYVATHLVFYDRFHDFFLFPDALICNLTPLEKIESEIDRLFIHNLYYNTAFALLSHEQYSYPNYSHYLPDHLLRIERACKHTTESGYKPVFFTHGIYGNTAWERG